MTENILRIHFNDGEPNITEMSEILLKKGFRQLTDANEETLPAGTVALIYNRENNVIVPIVVINHLPLGFNYVIFNDMTNDPDVEFMHKDHHFEKLFYKKLAQIPLVGHTPQLEAIPQIFEEAGFRTLATATPENLPEGCIALLYIEPAVIIPAVVRVLSLSNKRFLYLCQGMTAGNWESAVLMDHLKPFRKHSYLVIS